MRVGMEITEVCGRMVYDGGGNPTVEAEIVLENGARGRAAAPSGLLSEALVSDTVRWINDAVSETLLFEDASDQWYIDQLLLECGCRRARVNAQAAEILAVSMAAARAAAAGLSLPLFRYLGGAVPGRLPVPVMHMLQGGSEVRRAGRPSMDLQGLSVVPVAAGSFAEALQRGVEIWHSLKKLLLASGYSVAAGPLGGFMPELKSTEEALRYLTDAVELAGYKPGADVSIAVDAGAEKLYDTENGLYLFPGESAQNGRHVERDAREMTDYYRRLADGYPVSCIADGLSSGDWDGWKHLTDTLGHKVQLSGGALFASGKDRLEKGIREGAANAITVSMPEAGTVSGTIELIDMAKSAGYQTILSGRHGETEDAFLSDMAAAAGVPFIWLGAPCRTEQTAKYNELLRIEELIFN